MIIYEEVGFLKLISWKQFFLARSLVEYLTRQRRTEYWEDYSAKYYFGEKEIEMTKEKDIKGEIKNSIEICLDLLEELFQEEYEKVFAYLSGSLSEEKYKLAVNVVETFEDNLDILSDTISEIRLLKEIKDIPSKLFMRKFERYCRGLMTIPIEERADYLEKVGKNFFYKESIFIFNIINKIEEEKKIDILLKLFEAKLYEKISDDIYRRMVILTSNTIYEDLIYLSQDIKNENFSLSSEQEGLLGCGWIVFVGIGFNEDDRSLNNARFAYTAMAKKYCRIVFGNPISGSDPDYSGTFQVKLSKDENGESVTIL